MPNIQQTRNWLLTRPAVVGGFSLTFGGKVLTTSMGTGLSYASIPHSAVNDRVAAVVFWYPGGAVTAVSIGADNFTQVASASAAVGAIAVDVWISSGAIASSSSTASVTYASATTYHSAVGLYDLKSTTLTASAARTGTQAAGTSVVVSSALTVPAGGGALVGVLTQNGSTFTPSNFTTDASDVTGGVNFVWGHTTATGSISPGGTSFSVSDAAAVSAVAWGP